MHGLLQQAVEAIEQSDDRDVSWGFLCLGEAFSVNRMPSYRSDLVPEVNALNLGGDEVDALQVKIQSWIERHPGHSCMTAAIHALGQSRDASLERFFAQRLRHHLQALAPELDAMGQLLVELNRLGANATTGSAYSNNDYAKNLADALQYLQAVDRQKSRR